MRVPRLIAQAQATFCALLGPWLKPYAVTLSQRKLSEVHEEFSQKFIDVILCVLGAGGFPALAYNSRSLIPV